MVFDRVLQIQEEVTAIDIRATRRHLHCQKKGVELLKNIYYTLEPGWRLQYLTIGRIRRRIAE
jgi:hypothetical protein